MHFIAWFALIPLFLLITHSGYLKAFFASLAVGIVFFCGLLWWTLKLEGVGVRHFIPFILVNSSYFGIFGILSCYFQKKCPQWMALTFPVTWTLLEYLHSHLGFLSFPWGILGYSQYTALPVARLSSLIGVYGVSFLIVTVNTALSAMILSRTSQHTVDIFNKMPASGFNAGKASFNILLLITILFSASLSYGLVHSPEMDTQPVMKAAIIQGNAYDDSKQDPRLRELAFQKYYDLAVKAAASKPDIIIWPESSVPGNIPYDRILVNMLSGLAQRTESFLLIGSSAYDKFSTIKKRARGFSNSAFLFSPQGDITGKYNKVRLLPFNEYLPLRGRFKWPSWFVSSDMTDYRPGEALTVFDMNKSKFGVLICWENLFPDQFRMIASNEKGFIASLTNEKFTDVPYAHYQMFAMNVFRAIENHIPIIRVSTTGVSGFIDPDGHIITRVHDKELNDVNTEGYAVSDVRLSFERTFYNRHGDVFIYMLAALFMGLFLYSIIRRRHCPET